ncbi:MAG TPA: Uma2 family endonuclease [Pyrinomonadaceae bacterium]|nr:Uma2 family endonuclease [Pyrinomonadaceae bacterium]
MSSQTTPTYSPQQYLAIERDAKEKHEYLNGEIFALAGASERHNLITGNLFASIHVQLRGKACKVYSGDMRLRVSATGLYTYPDVVALCGDAHFDDEQRDTLVNPNLIIEVISKSTEGYDRGEKFAHYRRLESLAEYLLVSQDKYRIEQYVRQPDNQWLMSEVAKLEENIELPSIKCKLPLSDVYDRVQPV